MGVMGQSLKQLRQTNPVLKAKSRYRPQDMFSESDVLELINNCDHPRNKALISVLYEALRPHEALALKIGDIYFHPKYAQLTVPENTKTGTRTIPIIFAFPFVRDWINNHPLKNDLNAPLFINLHSRKPRPISHRQLWAFFDRSKAQLNHRLQKRYWNPYILRHSRLTEYAKVLTEFQLKAYAGWTPDSPMSSVYVHLSSKDLAPNLLAHYGIEDAKTVAKPQPTARECQRCKHVNSVIDKVCVCGNVLDVNTYEEIRVREDEQQKLIADLLHAFNTGMSWDEFANTRKKVP